MKLGDIKDLLVLGVIVGAAYYIYKNRDKFDPTSDQNLAYQAANAAARWLSGDPNQTVGGLFFDYFNPGAAGESLFYTVFFPDGSRHAIPSSTVDPTGFFYYNNAIPYRIVDDQNHHHYAVAV